MYNIIIVHLSDAFCDLGENMAGFVFRQWIYSQTFKVAQEVAALLKFGNYESLTLLLELFDQLSHICASIASIQSLTFWDVVLHCVLLVLLFVHGFDGNVLASNLMLGKPDGVARAAPDFLNQLVLVKVALEPLMV